MVSRAMARGATAAECVIREGDEFSTVVRLGQVETLKEAGSKAIGVRVFYGQRAASTYSSDFSSEGLERMLKSALELGEDYFRRPLRGHSGSVAAGLVCAAISISFTADVYSLPGEERISYARRAEKAALDFDPRIKNSDGGSFDAATGHKILANSHGFVGEYQPLLLFGGRGSDRADGRRRPCSATTGSRSRAAWASWNRPSTWAR